MLNTEGGDCREYLIGTDYQKLTFYFTSRELNERQSVPISGLTCTAREGEITWESYLEKKNISL